MSPWSMLLEPAVLFFVLGVLVALVGSNLEIPQPVAKFLSLYLLMAVGFKGGQSLAHTGLGGEVGRVVALAMLLAVAIPTWSYLILKRGVGTYDAAAIAATYGSVSAVTFTVASQFVAAHGAPTSGGATVALVLMESPAIIMAVLLASWARSQAATLAPATGAAEPGVESVVPEAVGEARPAAPVQLKAVLHEAFTDGAHLLLIGSLVIGALTGAKGAEAMKPFTGDLFKGFLAFFLLEMGILVGRQMRQVRDVGPFLLGFGLIMPPLHALLGIALARVAGLSTGDAVLLAALAASASYIVVPAVVRYAIPEARPSRYFTLALAVTFPFNVLAGIPLYHQVVRRIWGS